MAELPTPRVRILEQPGKVLRFRYMSEGRLAGSILGASSVPPEHKTYPTVQIEGYQGRALVIVSCVTKDAPYRPHPHRLVGKEGCSKGVCCMEVNQETMSAEFTSLGIQCTKKRDIKDSLRIRKEIRVDPFNTGFAHANTPASIDLTAVRLCFQVLLDVEQKGEFTVPLNPVVSEPVYHERALCDLTIVKLSKCVSPVDGGMEEIILVCDRVSKNDIQIRFYEEKDGEIVWEGFGIFKPSNVYKQVVIWFKPPSYKDLNVTEPVNVFIQLRKPSDGTTSEPLPFQLLPLDSVLKIRQKSGKPLKDHPLLHQLLPEKENYQFANMSNIFINSTQMKSNDPAPSPSGRHVYNDLLYAPSLASPPQRRYRTPVNSVDTTPAVTNSQPNYLLLPNIESLNVTSDLDLFMYDGDQLYHGENQMYTPNLTLPETQQYRPCPMVSTSPSAGVQQNILSFPNPESSVIAATASKSNVLSPNYISHVPTTITQNGPDEHNSSGMDIDTPSGLSDLLQGEDQPSELRLLNLDSGELDNMSDLNSNNLS